MGNKSIMMKYFYLLFVVLMSFTACIKEESEPKPIVDPMPEKLLSRDSLTSGQKWGLAIGMSAAEVYSKIQAIKAERHIVHLSVVGNVFTNLESLDNKIHLYTSILLDQKIGTENGIQIYFAENKVKSIWTNGGIQLTSWPSKSNKTASVIVVGDQTTAIYPKLLNIKRMPLYASKFERISLFTKDLEQAYDMPLSMSTLWYLTSDTDNTSYTRLYLNFKAGVLISIYTEVYEKP
jgi:hypothetical protein